VIMNDALAWASDQEIFVEVAGVRKRVVLGDCAKRVNPSGRVTELQYLVTKRLVEASREAMFKGASRD